MLASWRRGGLGVFVGLGLAEQLLAFEVGALGGVEIAQEGRARRDGAGDRSSRSGGDLVADFVQQLLVSAGGRRSSSSRTWSSKTP